MVEPTTQPAPNTAVDSLYAAAGPEWLRIGGVALAVHEPERVEAFYREVVGLAVVERAADVVRLGAGGVGFLDLLRRPDALPDDPASAGLFHTAFLLPSRADLGRWLAHSGALRQPLDGAADHLVSEAAYLSDPEGNGVEVYADRPRAQWPWSGGPEGGRVEMVNRPLDAEGLLREGGGATWTGAPEGTRIGHVHLRVGDTAEARRFYGDVLGMDVTAAWPGAVFLSTGGYHHHLAANTWRSAGAGPRDPRRAGLAWVTLEVSDEHAPVNIARRSRESDPAGHSLRDPWGTVLRFQAAAHLTRLPNPTEE